MTHTVFICETCADARGHAVGAALADAVKGRVSEQVQVQTVACLNVCDQPVSLALRAPDKVAYLFAGVGTDDVDDVVALTELYVKAEGGVIEDARPAGRLRFCLLGRIPT